jgi:hypothetical protein
MASQRINRIMFGFARVQDSTTSLPKFVLIQWVGLVLCPFAKFLTHISKCGSGVPVNRKGLFLNHCAAVSGFLKGAHVTIQARSEGDLDIDLIKKKVADSSGSKYSVHNEKSVRMTAPAPVVCSNKILTSLLDAQPRRALRTFQSVDLTSLPWSTSPERHRQQ